MAAVWRSHCAFARLFGGKSRKIFNNAAHFGKTFTREPISMAPAMRCYSNYAHSPFVERVKEQYEFEAVRNPDAWQFVERLLPFETIPEVAPKENYPSGWIAPREEAKDLPFFIERTKNHQLPVYLKLKQRGQSKITSIRKIDGDIWLLNEALKSYLSEKNKKYVTSKVHELGRYIEIKGDYVNDVQHWAYSKGF